MLTTLTYKQLSPKYYRRMSIVICDYKAAYGVTLHRKGTNAGGFRIGDGFARTPNDFL